MSNIPQYSPSSRYSSPLSVEQEPSEVLKELLRSSPYRELWEQFVQRRRGDQINIRAVASVLAYELSEEAGHELNTEHLKDSVRRALSGELMTDRTVHRFIAAFGFSPAETQKLWAAIVNARKKMIVLDGDSAEEEKKTKEYVSHRTLEQTIQVTCDEFGLVKYLDVTHSFIVEASTLEFIKPVIESSELHIEMIEGGEILDIEPSQVHLYKNNHENFHGVVIRFPRALHKNEAHRIRLRVHTNETYDQVADLNGVNWFITGAIDQPKFNITTIMNFEKPPERCSYMVWEGTNFEHPIYQEIMPSRKKHYSMHSELTHKSYFGFEWSTRAPKDPENKG